MRSLEWIVMWSSCRASLSEIAKLVDMEAMKTLLESLELTSDLALRVEMWLLEMNNAGSGLVWLRVEHADCFPCWLVSALICVAL